MERLDIIDTLSLLLSIGLLTSYPPIGIVVALVCFGLAFARRSTLIQEYLLGNDTPRTVIIDWLLPLPHKQEQKLLTTSNDDPFAGEQKQSNVTTVPNNKVFSLRQWLPLVNDKLDDAPHLLIIGPTGVGKTVLAQAILMARKGKVFICDPKPKPHKWGGLEFVTVDDDGEFTPIEVAIQQVLSEHKRRLAEMKKGVQDFEQLTIVVDEFPAVKAECPSAPILLKRLGSLGRELRIRLVLLTQSDRVKSLGISGEGDARDNFTVIRLGAYAIDKLPSTRSMVRPAVLEWKGEYWPIETAGLLAAVDKYQIDTNRLWHQSTPTHTSDDLVLLSSLLASEGGNDDSKSGNAGNEGVTAAESHVTTSLPVTVTMSEAAKIAYLLSSLPPSEVAKRLDGYSPRKYVAYREKVDAVKAMLDQDEGVS